MDLSPDIFGRMLRRFEAQVAHLGDGEEFSTPTWTRATVGKGRILDRVIKAIEINYSRTIRNNLVDWPNRYGHKSRSHRALLEATSDSAARRKLESWLLDFFQNRLPEPEAFDEFCELAGKRYDLVAYLFFLKDWNRFMPIRPMHFDEAFDLLGLDVVTSQRCSWENYVHYNDALRVIQGALRGSGILDARLIDAHSFCWMLATLRVPRLARPVISAPVPLFGLHGVGVQIGASRSVDEDETVDESEFIKREAEQRRLGALAQEISLESERERLRQVGHPDPVRAVRAVWNQPRRGFDIESCEVDGTPRYIEVKAARLSGRRLSFFLSENERKKASELSNYHFYVVINPSSKRPIVHALASEEVSKNCLIPQTYLVVGHADEV